MKNRNIVNQNDAKGQKDESSVIHTHRRPTGKTNAKRRRKQSANQTNVIDTTNVDTNINANTSTKSNHVDNIASIQNTTNSSHSQFDAFLSIILPDSRTTNISVSISMTIADVTQIALQKCQISVSDVSSADIMHTKQSTK